MRVTALNFRISLLHLQILLVQHLHSRQLQSGTHSLLSRGSTLQKPRTLFGETRRIPKKPQGFRQNPTETRESPWSWLHRIHKNPLESPGILRNPQEFLGIPRNPQKSWESSEILLKYFWKPRTKFLKCRAPRNWVPWPLYKWRNSTATASLWFICVKVYYV